MPNIFSVATFYPKNPTKMSLNLFEFQILNFSIISNFSMFEILKSLTVVEPLAQRLSNHGPYVLMFLSGHFIFIDEEKF